jgi:nucleotide-binding universal stress UspA family protein
MKNILIPTDFSENATEAAKIGIDLARRLRANALLINSYANFPIAVTYGGGSWLVDEYLVKKSHSQNHLELIVEELEPADINKSETEFSPRITCKAVEGEIGANVGEICQDQKIELVVVGARGSDHSVFGSDINSIIDKSSRPVLVITAGTDLQKIRKVVFTSDFNMEDVEALKYLGRLGEILNFKIDVIHVNEYGTNHDVQNAGKLSFEKTLTGLKIRGLSFHQMAGKDVIRRLTTLSQENDAFLLTMVHQQHSFFLRLFESSTAKTLLARQKVPMLIFPSKMV